MVQCLPGIRSNLDLHFTVIVSTNIIPTPEPQSWVLIRRRHHKGRTVQPTVGVPRIVAAQNGGRAVRSGMGRTWPAGRDAYLPSSGFVIPIADSLFKALDRAIGETYGIGAFDHADLVHIPTVSNITVGDNLKGNLDGFAGVSAQVHHRACPHTTAGIIVTRREVDPGVGAIFDLHHAIAVAAESKPTPELKSRILAGGGHY